MASGGFLKSFALERQRQREYAEEALKLLGQLLFGGSCMTKHPKPDVFFLEDIEKHEAKIEITIIDHGFFLYFPPIDKSIIAKSDEELDAYLLAYYKRYREPQPG